MPRISSITIDGPAASGKTTLGKQLSDRLGFLFLDTGVMYRAVTWLALYRHVDVNDEIAVTALAERTEIDIRSPSKADGRINDILADGLDITWEIRKSVIDANVSVISAYQGVRQALMLQQCRIAKRGPIIMMGRDIGTVVLPEAELKIYLDASDETRASRRYQEIVNRGGNADYNRILLAIRERDRIDSTRTFAPLKPAPDAEIINSDQMLPMDVFNHVLELIKVRNSQDC